MRVSVTAVVAMLAGVPSSATAQTALVDRVSWLAGCWEMRAPNRLTLEMWMPPFGNVMLGASRTVTGGVMREYEYLRLSVRGDTLVYSAIPSGQQPTDFKTIIVSDTAIAFENRAHDFPQVVRYRRIGQDSLMARIEGPGPNNTTRGANFPMRRVSCTDVPAPPPPAAPPPPPTDTLIADARLSPDGRRMLVVKGWGANWDIYIANPDGTAARPLVNHANVDYQAAWSPDGSRVAFVSSRDGKWQIYSVRTDGSDFVQLTQGTADNREPAWSPDGRTIAFRTERDGGQSHVYLMNADGSNQRALTRDSATAMAPSWSPDGKRIAFSSTRTGRNEVYVMNADGSGVRQLTETPSAGGVRQSGFPWWSPDGRMIAFWSTRDGNDEVYVMNADGTNPRNVSNHAGRELVLGWSPDGVYILFRSTRDRPLNEVYRVRPDGTGLARVTTTVTPPR